MKFLATSYLRFVYEVPLIRRGAFACIGLVILASAAEIAVALTLLPVLATLGVDAGNEFDRFTGLLPPAGWVALFVFAAGTRSLCSWLSAVQQEKSTQEIVVSLQSGLYGALAGAHWDAVRNLAPPRITAALQSQAYEASYGFSYLIQVISATILIVGYVLSSAAVFPVMFPGLILILLALWIINARRNLQVSEISEGYVSAYTELHQRYEDWVALSRISSLGVDVDKLAAQFDADAREAASHSVAYSRTSAATAVSYDAARIVAIAVGVPIAWWLEAPPAILAFGVVALIRVLPQASGIQTGYQGIINAIPPLRSIRQLSADLERDQITDSALSDPLQWQILELKAVSLKESTPETGDRWILRNVDVTLNSREWLALTGATGAGKTTLAELMLMLIRPDEGELRLDGKEVDDELASRWRHQCAYVPQDVVLLDASIRENLRLYVPDATDQELLNALETAAAGFVTTQLPEGLDTRAGPGGRWLSGGERQRIGIARTLLRQPGFLVLDEPTAALDSDTQKELINSLMSLKQEMSVVLITHRQELLELADRVITLDSGKISNY